MTTTPAVKAAAEAIMQFETGGHCLPGQACQICDCGADNATPQQLADERRRYEAAAYYILTKALGDVDEMAAAIHRNWRHHANTGTKNTPEKFAREFAENALTAILGDCPTCTRPHRETTGMVCQTCGTDHGDRNNQ